MPGALFTVYCTKRILVLGLALLLGGAGFSSLALAAESHIRQKSELEYGPVLYEYHQHEYFDALVQNAYVKDINNPISQRVSSEILRGAMLLSYGMPNAAEPLFQSLLKQTQDTETRNRAWYHLARLYYNKSDRSGALRAISQIKGKIPKDLHVEYHYLASLLKSDGKHLEAVNEAINSLSEEMPHYSYLLFNLAVTQLRAGNVLTAVEKLESIAAYTGPNRELQALSDRAKHGLAQLATQAGDLPTAWRYLTGIRTSGLYSNRALLSYAWTAINMKLYAEAIPALQLLDQRSIAIPEVQEAKVLLAHLYEQEGSPRKALKSNVLAEKAFKEGLATLKQAREIIARQDVPREFIENLEVIMDESDWYRTTASVDYKKLTPFLIDLMASNAFNETLKDLAALYTLEDNLQYWLSQTSEHLLILKNVKGADLTAELDKLLERSKALDDQLNDQKAEIRLKTLTLPEEATERFQVLLENTEHDLYLLEDKIRRLGRIEGPYVQPAEYQPLVATNHQRIKTELKQTQRYIRMLEPVMRKLVNQELNKHEERMNYYWAQSRLAKARLFDSTLLELENVRSEKQSEQ